MHKMSTFCHSTLPPMTSNRATYRLDCVCVCVCVCSNANRLHYFRITHRLGRPHYVWDEYLYSVREKVEVRVIVSVTVCVVWDADDRKGEDETRCRLIACSSRKAPKGPLGLTSPNGIVWNLIQDCDVQSSD